MNTHKWHNRNQSYNNHELNGSKIMLCFRRMESTILFDYYFSYILKKKNKV